MRWASGDPVTIIEHVSECLVVRRAPGTRGARCREQTRSHTITVGIRTGDRIVAALRGEFGVAGAVRPATGSGSRRTPARCLRGHSLAVGGASAGWSHAYGLPTVTCEVCYTRRDSKATWCLLDPTVQYSAGQAPDLGLVLVTLPPARRRAGIGRIELRWDRQPVGAVWLAICAPCRRAVLTDLRVEPDRRRLGYGSVLVEAATALASPAAYRWSTTALPDSPEVLAFWATIGGFPGLGEPEPCSDIHLPERRQQ